VKRADVPVLFLSAEALDGRPVQNPVFVAVPVTVGLCGHLADAGNRAGRHPLQTGRPVPVRRRHTDFPLHWDFEAGTALDVVLEEHVDWLVTAHRAQAELWGRRCYADGGYGAPEPLVRSRSVSLATIARLAGSTFGFVFDAHHRWVDHDGEPFALAVHRRLRALGARDPPFGVRGHPELGGGSKGRTPGSWRFRDDNSQKRVKPADPSRY